jgi:hypothetical protein
MEYLTLDEDRVIQGYVIAARSNYGYALQSLAPLIGKLDIQRDPLKAKFYSRLEADIIRGCVMPPLTIALIRDLGTGLDIEAASEFLRENIASGFVLDGIQRLTTLQRAAEKEGFDRDRPIHINFLVAKSRDRLLYRMITLNNGQKAMSARHQIDVLADEFFDFGSVDLNLVAEKGGGRVRAPDTFKKADFVKGYIAYLSNSVSIDNQKIIEEKMDELLAARIIESDIPVSPIEFSDVVNLINRFSQSDYLKDWIRSANNFIGFCVGIRSSLNALNAVGIPSIETGVRTFEAAFSSVDVSKVNLGKVRRQAVSKFIEGYEHSSELDEFSLLDKISDWI